MAKWQDLPTELILYILQNLNNTRDHNSASWVSRQFHALVEPQLYSYIWILPNNDLVYEADDDSNGVEDRTRAFRHFVRTIVARPSLGAHVKTLGLASWEPMKTHYDYSEDIRLCHLNLSEEESREALEDAPSDGAREDLTLIATAAVAKGLPNGMVLSAGSRGLAILLLHYVPNLKDLLIMSLNEIETVALTCFGFFDGGVPAGLLSINSIDMVYDDTEVRPRICGDLLLS